VTTIAPVDAGEVSNPADPSVRLRWERFGTSSEPLLLINGLGSPSVAFELGFVEELVDRGLSVVRFDNRDTGRSSRCDGATGSERPYAVTDMVADAVAVLDAAGWDSAHVLGQSMGGMIAQQLAIEHPQRTRSLISFMSTTGNPAFGLPSPEALEALLTVQPADRDGWLAHRVETERIWASPDHWDPACVRAKGELMFDYGVDPQGTTRQFRAVTGSSSRDDVLARLSVPTLVLHGTADTLITPGGGEHTAEVIPSARYVAVEGLGHDLPPARWAEVAGLIAEFCLSPY
jgi:pimeloyl-ACP methyl ester carboxylesterase